MTPSTYTLLDASSVGQLLLDAEALHVAGRLDEAERAYRGILTMSPAHADALHQLGVVRYQTGHLAEALRLIDQALLCAADCARIHNSRAAVLMALSRDEEALASYERALVISPNAQVAAVNRGDLLMKLQRYGEALEAFAAALAIDPSHANALAGRGNALFALERYDEAVQSFIAALQHQPGLLKTQIAQSWALLSLGKLNEALSLFDHLLRRFPDSVTVRYGRAEALAKLGRDADALAAFDATLALDPAVPEAHFGRAAVLVSLYRWQEAAAGYAEAQRCKQSDFPEAQINRAEILSRLRHFQEARRLYDGILVRHPDSIEARYNNSTCRLALGDFAEGWRTYECRWQLPQLKPTWREVAQPQWRGDIDLTDKTILLHAEQGMGDAIQFCRYAVLVAESANVVLEVPDPLVRLLTSLPGRGRIVPRGEPLPPFDLHCPLMSLPLAFGTTVETIPAPIRYLAADPAAVEGWRQRLAALPGRRIGLCWAGSPRPATIDPTGTDQRRSITLAHYAPLAAIPGVSFVSLQKGEAAAQTATPSAGMTIHDWADELGDFAETAALIEALDLVITVDTSVAHLAGALGKPVWVLNRFDACWRWLIDRSDSPWYPTARLFRQAAPGDWDSVIAAVGEALREQFAGDLAGRGPDQPPER